MASRNDSVITWPSESNRIIRSSFSGIRNRTPTRKSLMSTERNSSCGSAEFGAGFSINVDIDDCASRHSAQRGRDGSKNGFLSVSFLGERFLTERHSNSPPATEFGAPWRFLREFSPVQDRDTGSQNSLS
jgi:hypothetical protein